MLIQQLRKLERDGLVHRQVYSQVPPKVEYSSIDYAESFKPVLEVFCNWGEKHLKKIPDNS